jgi:hypothetical protein
VRPLVNSLGLTKAAMPTRNRDDWPWLKQPDADRDTFLPKLPLEGRSNFRRQFYVEPDGSVSERVYLYVVDNRHREEVICTHFLQFFVRHFIQEETGVNFLSCDKPWDFQIELSTGLVFNLEIVSIGDNRLQREHFTREASLDRLTDEPKIRLRQLRKIRNWFGDEALEGVIAQYDRDGRMPDQLVENPYYDGNPTSGPKRIFFGRAAAADGPIGELIESAIAKKEAKRHSGKENTVLILDNRTSVLYVDEVTTAMESIHERLARSPFREIWFYHGYCSDWDGNNGAYTLIPFKLSSERVEHLSQALNQERQF